MGHWLQLLTDRQRVNLQKWQYCVDDPSITTQLLSPFWNTAVTWVSKASLVRLTKNLTGFSRFQTM